MTPPTLADPGGDEPQRFRRSGEPRQSPAPPPEPSAEPVVAALTQESATGTRDQLRRRLQPTPWMERIKDYDLNGPGVAGYYLDTVALMAMLCPLYVSVRNRTGEFERSDDSILQVGLDAYRGTLMSQPELVAAAVRGRESLGRVWHVRDVETGYNVVPQARNLDKDRIGWTDMYGRPRITPIGDSWRSWIPDPYEPWNPTSPMRRALPDLKRIRSSVRNQTRAADSRLTTNGIVSFPHDPSQAGSRPFDGIDASGRDGGKQGVPKIIDDYIELSKLAHTDDESPASSVPFPIPGLAPVWTAIGRDMDPTSLEAERIGIEGFARAVNFPQQLLVSGPGSSNHWNEFLTQETAVKVFLAPKLEPVCNDILTFHLQGLIQQFRAGLTEWRRSIDPRHIRVEYDLSFLLRRPSKTTEMMEAYRLGVATRQQVADELGIEGDILPLPNGLSEFEMWELATMGKGAPYAEVDRENNLIVPDPMGGMGLPPADPGAVTDVPLNAPADAGGQVVEALGAGPAAPLALPSGGDGTVAEPTMPVTAAMSMAADVAKGMRARARSTRPAAKPSANGDGDEEPAAVRAAMSQEDRVAAETTRQLWADAAAADVTVSAELVGLLNAVTTEVQREVARQVIMAHPARSEERAALSKLPVGQVWVNADPAVKQVFPLEQVVDEVVDRYRPQVQAAYEEAAQGFLDRWGGVIAAVVVTGALTSATDTLVKGFTGWALHRYRPTLSAGVWLTLGDAEDRKGLGLTTTAGTQAIPPTMIVRDSLIVAGGAQRDREGLPLRDGGGNPTPVVNDVGGRWSGGSGWLTGHNVVAASPRRPIRWRWHHAFIRRPKEPFKPHLDLDGKLFDTPADVPGGWFPSDHPFCSCGLLPEV